MKQSLLWLRVDTSVVVWYRTVDMNSWRWIKTDLVGGAHLPLCITTLFLCLKNECSFGPVQSTTESQRLWSPYECTENQVSVISFLCQGMENSKCVSWKETSGLDMQLRICSASPCLIDAFIKESDAVGSTFSFDRLALLKDVLSVSTVPPAVESRTCSSFTTASLFNVKWNTIIKKEDFLLVKACIIVYFFQKATCYICKVMLMYLWDRPFWTVLILLYD